jgi:hypothetical protein
MPSSKKIGLYRHFAAGAYLSEAQNPKPPLPLKHCIRVYSILIHRGKGGELNQREGKGWGRFTKNVKLREGERGNSSQSWVENTNMTDCISSL